MIDQFYRKGLKGFTRIFKNKNNKEKGRIMVKAGKVKKKGQTQYEKTIIELKRRAAKFHKSSTAF